MRISDWSSDVCSSDLGTTFSIYLPAVAEQEAVATLQDAEAQERRDLTGAGTLLLVEDEDAVRAFSARALRNKGYNVLEANSGETALEILASQEAPIDRSEEHTSELQSLMRISYAVFCLKKKKKNTRQIPSDKSK